MSNVAAIAVGGAASSARKVLRLASGLRRPTRPIRISRGGVGWCSLQGSLEAGFAGLPGRAHFHVRAAGGRCPMEM